MEERPTDDRVVFRCYLPASPAVTATARALRQRIRVLERYGVDPRPALVRLRRLATRRWATAWRASVRPVRVGSLVIRPPWVRTPPPRGTTVVSIDPGMAFGTGMHPSTRLCLRALLRYLSPGARVFDVGTGSGILAIAAARVRDARVWAVDLDPVAVAAARANVRLNRVTRHVRVVRGDGLASAPGRADFVLANLVADTILPMLPHIRRRLVPGGYAVVSGLVAERTAEVSRAAHEAGLGVVEVLAEGEWRAVVLVRPRDVGRQGRDVCGAAVPESCGSDPATLRNEGGSGSSLRTDSPRRAHVQSLRLTLGPPVESGTR